MPRLAFWRIFYHVKEGHRNEFNHTLSSEEAHIVGVLHLLLCQSENCFVQHSVESVVIELTHWHSLNDILMFLDLFIFKEIWVSIELDVVLQSALHGSRVATLERLFVFLSLFLLLDLLFSIEFDLRLKL